MSFFRPRSAAGHSGLGRAEKMMLTCAVVRGVVAGVTRTVVGWLIDHFT
jgi:hypothetical protein